MSVERSLYLDQIKAVIVALVIALHVPMAFGDISWIGVRIPVEESVGPFSKDFSSGTTMQLTRSSCP